MKNESLNIMKRIKLDGMATAYEAILSLPVNQQPDAHEMVARLADAEAQHRKHRFVRIRHYGILSNRSKGEALQAARLALGALAPPVAEQPKEAFNPLLPRHYCSCCGATTTHLLVAVLPPARAGPFAEALGKICKAVF